MSETPKSRGGRPRVDATPITVRVPPDMLAPLDVALSSQPDPKPSRPEMIRRALGEWLRERGFLPSP